MRRAAFRTASVAVSALSLLSLVSLAAPSLRAQSAVPDSVRIERLASLGRLWGAVKYFHPALATRPIDWDSALVATIPRVRAARTRDEYAAALDAMLGVLGDPATHVLSSTPPVQLAGSAGAAASNSTSARWTADSTFVVTIANPTELSTVSGALSGMQADVARAPRVVFDLRTHGADRPTGYVGFILGSTGVASMLTSSTISAPAVRSRMYSGFPTQVGVSSGGYYTGWVEKAGEVITPRAGSRAPRVGFLIDQHSDLPPLALALQQTGAGVIVAEGAEARNGVANAQNVWTTTLADSVRVAVRVSELVTTDGTSGEPDTVVSGIAGSAGSDPALDAAVALVRAPARAHARQPGTARFTAPPENAYREMRSPSLEYRLLAAYRFWNAINYFYPYKALTGENWSRVLVAAIPEFEAARDSTEYGLAVAHLVTHIHDSHGFVSTMTLVPYRGRVPPPAKVRYIEGKPVITELSKDTSITRLDVHVGDVVVKIDDMTAEARRAKLEPILSHSTPQALDQTLTNFLLNGLEGKEATLVLRGADNRDRVVRMPRVIALIMQMRETRPGGPVWRILPGNIGYVDLEKLTVSQVDSMFDALRDTKAIIFDNRSFPQGTMWAIGPRLTAKHDVPVARWRRPVVTSPDTSEWDEHAFVQTVSTSDKWRYAKPTVMLVDERTISQAEHTALYFKAANGTTIVGSPTMGADGDITTVIMPGGVTANFTGYEVRRADGSQLQRVGITPDVLVRPTIAGIRAGRDEVLERAVKFVEQGR